MPGNIFTNDNAWTVIWISAVVSSIIGFGFLLHSTYIAWRWPKAMGKVVGHRSGYSHHDSGSSVVHFSEIEFQAHDGKVYRISGDVGHQTPRPGGELIEVHYKPSNPAHAMTMKLWERLVFSGFFIAMSLVLWAIITGIIERS
jgi:hypothetical protein